VQADALPLASGHDLKRELSGGAGVNNTLPTTASTPLTDQQTYEGLARPSRQFKSDISCVQVVPAVCPQLIDLVRPQRPRCGNTGRAGFGVSGIVVVLQALWCDSQSSDYGTLLRIDAL
jgi:hypothetical protein